MSTNSITNQSITSSADMVSALFPTVASTPTPGPEPYADVPNELKTLAHWACFHHETDSKGKTNNVPYRADGRGHAKVNDPSTWSPFADAMQASTNPARNFDGVSFMLQGTSYLGFDFDAVVQNKVLDQFVAAILHVMGDPYAEISYSGTGLHVVVNGPNLQRPHSTLFKKSGHGVEIYHGEWAGKALVVTGHRYSGQGVPTISPERFELVRLLCSQILDAKFKTLWLGDTSGYKSPSEADHALCRRLARLLGFDAKKIEAAFQWSGLAQAKWTERQDYRDRTIAAAVEFEKAQDKTPASENNVRVPVSGTADQIAPKKIVWLWPNRIAQKLNMIVGNPDLGKGLITHYITACVTTGRDWFGGKNTSSPSEVLIMSGEEDWDDTIVPRLMAAGADLSKVRWLKMSATKDGTPAEHELQLDRDAAALETFLTEHPDVRLVVVDPISNYLGSAKMIDEQRVREVLTPLKEIANRRRVAIICVMHLNKKVELDAIHRIGGAMAFVGVARMVWLCAPKPAEDGTESDELLMVKLKGNIVHRQLKGLSYTTKVHYVTIEGEEVATPYVEWIGEVDQNANEVMRKPAKPAHRPAEQLPACVDWLREYLKDGAKPLEEVESAGKALHGFSVKTIQRAREQAKIITFPSGKTKARDGKMRTAYSCKLSADDTAQIAEEEQTRF